MKLCQKCMTPFAPDKSVATLKNTYCGSICERAGLGFSIDGFLNCERVKTQPLEALLGGWAESLLDTLPEASQEVENPVADAIEAALVQTTNEQPPVQMFGFANPAFYFVNEGGLWP